MKAKFFSVLMVLGCALLMSTPALANSCDVNDEFCLINSNQGQFVPGQITIHVNNTGGNTWTIVAHADGGFFLKGIDKVAVNATTDGNDLAADGSNSLFGGSAVLPTGWSDDGQPDSDGFAGFSGAESGSSDSGGKSLSLTFTLDGAPVYQAGQTPTWVVHVRYDFEGQGCSAYISNVAQPNGGSNYNQGNCGGGSEVPEPGSLALLGTGLFSAVGVLRRKLLKA